VSKIPSIFKGAIFLTDTPALGNSLLALIFLLFGFSAVFGVAAYFCNKNAKVKILACCKYSVYSAALLHVLAFLLFASAFVSLNLRLDAVARYCSDDLSLFHRISACWAGAKGSLFLWSTLICISFSLWALYSSNYRKLEEIALPAGSFICLVFIFILKFTINPFTPSTQTIDQGVGLNPLLQNVWNVIHPPLLFIGYSLTAIPFMISVSAVFTNRIDEINTTKYIRKWILGGLVFLTLGILTGARWSYYELGWGGYWAWDAVENASLLPWLAGISALHCIAGDKMNSSFKSWVVIVCPLGFILTLIATFITRSGILQSVHAFAASPVSKPLLSFIILTILCWLVSVIYYFKKPGTENRKPASLSAKWQSDILFWTNITILFTVIVIMLATFSAPLSKIIRPGQTIQITRQFYDKFITVIAILLVLLITLSKVISLYKHRFFIPLLVLAVISACFLGMIPVYLFSANPLVTFTFGLCGLAAIVLILQHLSSHHKSLSSMLIHLGVLLLVASTALTQLQSTHNLSLQKNNPVKINDYTVTYKKFQRTEQAGITRIGPAINVSSDNFEETLFPHKNIYPNNQQTTEVSVHTTFLKDIYLWFESVDWNGNIIVGIKIIPFMLWFWISGLLITTGLVCSLIKRN